MSSRTTEKSFEDAIEESLLLEGGYEKGYPANFNRELALDTTILLDFIKTTQPKSWEKLTAVHGNDVEKKFLQRLTKELDTRGMLDVLRHGMTDYGVNFKLAYFRPASGRNPDSEKQYRSNVLTVTRQVKYSLKNENSIDIVLFVNGLPVATVELKNQFTGQDTNNAQRQYRYDRDNQELLLQFKKRALVHFAVDTDVVFMTTKLDKGKTRYLPFNKGYEEGAGNPPVENGHRTEYLWKEVWQRDSWLDILSKFLHLQVEEFETEGKKVKKETMIFPRFHQLDSVRKLEYDAKVNKAGKNYLIQHSAGSGKSNSIAWLAYRLANLHDAQDEPVFDSVVVVTDRKVLDKQLQDTIFQFDHKQGVVDKIEKGSTELAKALTQGTKIIITTLQKFPFVLDKIGELPARTYAVIVDEAHSSQGGEAAKKLKEVLSTKDLEEAEEIDSKNEEELNYEDSLRKSMLARGKQKNLSFFAFTATPKYKTLEVFGEKNKVTDKPEPFHLYSMRQAIEEGFIMDVLQNYTTYKTFYKLTKAIEDDPKINKKKANIAIARFLSLHPHNLSQKTEVIIEHFRRVVMPKIGGRAKAMVVTSSRAHVVKYKQEFDRYLKEKGYKEIKALVAFTGKIKDDLGELVTEPQINGFKEKELPAKFNTDEYQLLLVADKYQTGFDQPLLHTMYVDKRLSGVKAVQTLSRLNRTYPGKEDTFILDFVNETSEILESFQPYYEQTTLAEEADPNILYDLKTKLDATQIYWQTEIDNFCKVFFKSGKFQSIKAHGELNAYLDPAVDRFKDLEKKEVQEEFKHTLAIYQRTYSFLSQIMPFSDIELEKLHAFGKLLLTKLPKRDQQDRFKLDDEIALEYYRLQKISEGNIVLEKQVTVPLNSIKDAGANYNPEKEDVKLSELIEVLNERFGTEFTDADKLFFDQIEEELVVDEQLKKQAQNNSLDNFKYGFEDIFIDKLIERMGQNQEIFSKIMDDKTFGDLVRDILLKKVYKRLNDKDNSTTP